jgi:hypothetical protein
MEKIKDKICTIIPIFFSFLTCQLFFRIFEYAHLDELLKANYSFVEVYLSGFYQDVIISFCYGLLTFLLSLSTSNNVLIKFLNYFLGVLILLVQFLLSEYFKVTQIPLDETIFHFNSNELRMIIGTSSRLNLNVFMHLFTLVFCFILLSNVFKKLKPKILYLATFLYFLFGIISPFVLFKSGMGEERDVISSSKLYFFSSATLSYFLKDRNQDKLYQLSDFQNLNPNFLPNRNIHSEFPLLNDFKDTSSLANFLNKSDRVPNIVFLLIESLSSDFVGEYAHKTGNLMPFLDSLAKESLYFPNFLSTCERTHNVLPAVLSSLPNAPNGLMTLKMNPYPNHLSLQSLLKSTYYSRFYCGVDLSYHNMNTFMNFNQTDYLVQNWQRKFIENPFYVNNSWGHPDNSLFEKSFIDLGKNEHKNKPRLDVFLTISTHDPFEFPNKEKYTKIVKQIIKSKKLNKYYKSKLKHYPEKYASYKYLDDALKEYFQTAKNNKNDFNNTIFIICGDHGSELCYENALSKFRIPLLIYSPLIIKPKQFDAINSHLNLAPTLISYLKNEHKVKIPKQSVFLGDELDFTSNLILNKTLCFNSHQLKNEYLLYNKYFLDRKTLYKLNHKLEPIKINSKKLKDKMMEQLKLYNNFVSYLFFENKIITPKLSDLIINLKSFYLHYYNKPIMSAAFLDKEFISIGQDKININPEIQQIKFKFTTQIYITKNDSIDKLPTLVLSLDSFGENIYWKSNKAFFANKIKINQWNTASYEMVIQLKDIPNYKTKTLSFYLLNEDLIKFNARNFETKLYFQK